MTVRNIVLSLSLVVRGTPRLMGVRARNLRTPIRIVNGFQCWIWGEGWYGAPRTSLMDRQKARRKRPCGAAVGCWRLNCRRRSHHRASAGRIAPHNDEQATQTEAAQPNGLAGEEDRDLDRCDRGRG